MKTFEDNSENSPRVFSPEFPDAYIIGDVSTSKTRSETTNQTVTATVFVEETYGFDEKGEFTTLSSRLLSESEVLEIGYENFDDMEHARQEAISETMQTRAVTNSRGKLTITFSGTHSVTGKSVKCDLNGSASWSAGPGLFNGETNPYFGSDYMGITWSGGFSVSKAQMDVTPSIPVFSPPVFYQCGSVANVGRVWEFTETWGESLMGQGVSVYLSKITTDFTIYKNNMTGGGNTAEAVLKYIHTYESTKGQLNIGGSSDGSINAGFTLSGVSKQWSIVCAATNIPY